jgi:hypothetical protein
MRKALTRTVLISSLILLGSCSAFQKSVDIDMQPFSDNTTILFQEAAKVDRPFQFQSLTTYKDIDKYQELKIRAQPIIRGLRGIVYYSNQLVAISNSSMSARGKNDQLAIYVRDVMDRIDHRERTDSLGLTHAQIDSTILKIRKAETYREGIEAADPVAKSIVISMFDRLDELELLVEEVVLSFEEEIYQDHELVIANYLALKDLQNKTQFKLTQVYYAEAGHSNVLDSLMVSDMAMAKELSNQGSKGSIDFDAGEAFLLKRLENIDALLRQLDDDKKEFLDMKREIGIWHIQADEKIKITRNSLIVWSQTHKNLGQGIVTPPLIGVENLIDLVVPAVKSAF